MVNKLNGVEDKVLNKRILITGGTGFIGSKLVNQLMALDYSVTVLTRHPHNHLRKSISGSLQYTDNLQSLDPNGSWYGVINLGGEPLNFARWNEERKNHIVESRIKLTKSINSWMQGLKRPPTVYLSTSAVGWYGHWQDEVLTEESPFNDCFSHHLCSEWEKAASADVDADTRFCVMRLGIVLGLDGGPFPEMLLPAKLCASTMVTGRQWWSWIHVDDAVGLFIKALESEKYRGVFNLTAPEPVTQKLFSQVLARNLGRPALFPAPAFAMRMMLGEFADEILLKGQRVLPRKAEAAGYQFKFSTLDAALRSLLK